MAKLYKKFWISGEDNETMLFSEEEVEEYVKSFPKETEVLICKPPFCDWMVKFKTHSQQGGTAEFVGDVFIMKIRREINRLQFTG